MKGRLERVIELLVTHYQDEKLQPGPGPVKSADTPQGSQGNPSGTTATVSLPRLLGGQRVGSGSLAATPDSVPFLAARLTAIETA